MLYVVATPIGNLQDITFRAVEILKSVDMIIAEDTRVTAKLLNHFGIQNRLVSCHLHSERQKADSIVELMQCENLTAALVTDAGTPAVSDPGAYLVQRAVRMGIDVIAVPGANAAVCAVSISGIETKEFTFAGFPPREDKELREYLLLHAQRREVLVLHESPHRVLHLLRLMEQVIPGCMVSVSCDLTKIHEQTLRGSASNVLLQLSQNPNAEKGEYILVVDTRVSAPQIVKEPTVCLEAKLLNEIVGGADLHEAADRLTARGERRNAVYQASLHLRSMLKNEGGV